MRRELCALTKKWKDPWGQVFLQDQETVHQDARQHYGNGGGHTKETHRDQMSMKGPPEVQTLLMLFSQKNGCFTKVHSLVLFINVFFVRLPGNFYSKK